MTQQGGRVTVECFVSDGRWLFRYDLAIGRKPKRLTRHNN